MAGHRRRLLRHRGAGSARVAVHRGQIFDVNNSSRLAIRVNESSRFSLPLPRATKRGRPAFRRARSDVPPFRSETRKPARCEGRSRNVDGLQLDRQKLLDLIIYPDIGNYEAHMSEACNLDLIPATPAASGLSCGHHQMLQVENAFLRSSSECPDAAVRERSSWLDNLMVPVVVWGRRFGKPGYSAASTRGGAARRIVWVRRRSSRGETPKNPV